jgi:hypothetical protein
MEEKDSDVRHVSSFRDYVNSHFAAYSRTEESDKRLRCLRPHEKDQIIAVKSMLNMEEQQLERLRMDLSLRLKYDESILETSANNVRTLKRNYKGTMKAYVCTDEVADIIIGKHLESAHCKKRKDFGEFHDCEYPFLADQPFY